MMWLKNFGKAIEERTAQAFSAWHFRAEKAAASIKSMLLDMFQHRFMTPPRKTAAEWTKTHNTAPWIFAAVRPIADTISGSELEFYDGDKSLPANHFAATAMHANPFFSQHDLLYLAVLHFFAPGEFFWVAERRNNGEPFMWWPLPPHWVRDRPSINRPWFRVQFMGHGFGGATWDVPAENILWCKNCDPFDPYGPGVGRAESAGDEVQIYEYATKYNANFFLSSARPDAVLEYPPDVNFDEEKVEKIREKWAERYQGFWKSFKPAVLHSGMKVHLLDTTRKDMDFVEGMRYSSEVISAVIGTPKSIMGLLADSNRSNSEAAEYIFSKYTVYPIYDAIERAINRMLQPIYGAMFRARFKRPPLRDKEFEHKEALESLREGAITVQRYHELHGWEAPPDSEYYLVPRGRIAVRTFSEVPISLQPALPALPPAKAQQKAFPIVHKEAEEQAFIDAVLFDVKQATETFLAAMAPPYKAALTSAGEAAIAEIDVPIVFNVDNPHVKTFLAELESRIGGVGEETYGRIKDTLLDGYRKGEGVSEMMDRIEHEMSIAKGWRSENIARTEMTGALNGGALYGYEQAGVPYKGWLATDDERTRASHSDAEARYLTQPIPVTENFIVGGAVGPCPGRMSSAKESCSCRCTILPMFEEDLPKKTFTPDEKRERDERFRKALDPQEKKMAGIVRGLFAVQEEKLKANLQRYFA